MAAFTQPPEAAIVHVVAIVTATAASRQTDLTAHRSLVAGLAGQAHVTAIELEGAALVVIENPRLPVTGVVTQTAVRAEGALVLVLFGVTGAARGIGIPEGGSQVAFFALDLGVFTE